MAKHVPCPWNVLNRYIASESAKQNTLAERSRAMVGANAVLGNSATKPVSALHLPAQKIPNAPVRPSAKRTESAEPRAPLDRFALRILSAGLESASTESVPEPTVVLLQRKQMMMTTRVLSMPSRTKDLNYLGSVEEESPELSSDPSFCSHSAVFAYSAVEMLATEATSELHSILINGIVLT